MTAESNGPYAAKTNSTKGGFEMKSSMKACIAGASAVVAALAIVACSSDETPATPELDAGHVDSGTVTPDTGAPKDAATDTNPAGRKATLAIAPYGDSGTTMGAGTLDESTGAVTLTLDVTNAVPGSRGVHVHVGTSCAVGAPGPHFNPDLATRNGEWDNLQVNDAGVGHLVSTRQGLTLDPLSDGGTGIVGRVIAVHGAPLTYTDGGVLLTEAGTPQPPPISGCGVITAK
jgi:Cu/Zn superoxide dismutase